jgi:hypothetical protein
MLTIFSIPKAFIGHIEIIQKNAIQSWLSSACDCEVILCGDDKGTAEAAGRFGVYHLKNINRNSYGTPLLNSAFKQVQQIAKHKIICYINADIILLSNIEKAINQVPFNKFLMAGQRWDLDIKKPINFIEKNWKIILKREINKRGVLHPPYGSDYFIFPKGTIEHFPDFAVGRPGWDNWFIYHARSSGLPVIDATRAITIIHQNHDYRHVPERQGLKWQGPEAFENRLLSGGTQKRFDLLDVKWILKPGGISRAHTVPHLKRIIIAWPILHLKKYPRLQDIMYRLIILLCKVASSLLHRTKQLFHLTQKLLVIIFHFFKLII